MDNQVQSISSYLFRSEQLQVQCSLQLFDKYDETAMPVNVYNINKKRYIGIEPKVILRFKYTPKVGSTEYIVNNDSADQKYNPSFTAVIGPKEICGLQIMMERFWDAFNRDDLYIYNDDGYPEDMVVKKDNIVLASTMYHGAIQISPGIIYPPVNADGTQTSYPGILIAINKKSQVATITVDEYLYLMRIIDRFDFVQMGHRLLIEYLLLKRQSIDDTGKPQSSGVKEVNSRGLAMFAPQQQSQQQKETVSQKPFLNSTSNLTLDDLG